MKKKLSLLMVALVAIAAFAVQQTRRAAADVTIVFNNTETLTAMGFTELPASGAEGDCSADHRDQCGNGCL